jgi:hypothetical protein
LKDASYSVQAGRSLIVVAGTGRLADLLAAGLHGELMDPNVGKIVNSGLVRVVDLFAGRCALVEAIEEAFASQGSLRSNCKLTD